MQNNEGQVERLVKGIKEIFESKTSSLVLAPLYETQMKPLVKNFLEDELNITINDKILESEAFIELIQINRSDVTKYQAGVSEDAVTAFLVLQEVQEQLAAQSKNVEGNVVAPNAQQNDQKNEVQPNVEVKEGSNEIIDKNQQNNQGSNMQQQNDQNSKGLENNNEVQQNDQNSKGLENNNEVQQNEAQPALEVKEVSNKIINQINKEFASLKFPNGAKKDEIKTAKQEIVSNILKRKDGNVLKFNDVINDKLDQQLTTKDFRKLVNNNELRNNLDITKTNKSQRYSPIGGFGKFVGLFIGNGAADDIKNGRLGPGLGKILVRIAMIPLVPFALLGMLSKLRDLPGDGRISKVINSVKNVMSYPLRAFEKAADLTNTTINGQARKALEQRLNTVINTDTDVKEKYEKKINEKYSNIETARENLLKHAKFWEKPGINRQQNMLRKEAEAALKTDMLQWDMKIEGQEHKISKVINDNSLLDLDSKILSAIRDQMETSTIGMKKDGMTSMIGNNVLKFDQAKLIKRVDNKQALMSGIINAMPNGQKEQPQSFKDKLTEVPILNFSQKFDTNSLKDISKKATEQMKTKKNQTNIM